jgi:hypothetical protein
VCVKGPVLGQGLVHEVDEAVNNEFSIITGHLVVVG